MKGQLYTEKGQHPADTAWSLLSRGYTDGYKQALKDLDMNKKTIDCQVVMLPTKKSRLSNRNGELSFADVGGSYTGNHNPQHLYFTSDEEIKEGDWWISIANGIPPNGPHNRKSMWVSNKKIVASTNLSLGLPAIPESFLKQYAAANGKIDKVKLSLECVVCFSDNGECKRAKECCEKLKLKLTITNEVVVVDENILIDIKGEVMYCQDCKNTLTKDEVLLLGLCRKCGTISDEDKELEDAVKTLCNPLNNLIKKNDYNWLPIDETIQEFSVKSKPSIPTDEEIEKKAKDHALSVYGTYHDNRKSYIAGYKQALKDLGHE
jgi:hypothetical protein